MKCDRCGGQVKIEEHWEEGFCVFCGTKVRNDIISIDPSEYGACADADPSVDETLRAIAVQLNSEQVGDVSEMQRFNESMKARFTKYGDSLRSSKARYAGDIERFCHNVWRLPYEATRRTWDDLREAVEDLELGCAICLAYDDFTEAYMQGIDKLSDLLRMKWRPSRLNPQAPRIDRQELDELRGRTHTARSWLRFRNDCERSECILDRDARLEQ